MDFHSPVAPRKRAMRKTLAFNDPQSNKTHDPAIALLTRAMKLTGVILLAISLHVSARSDAQQRIAISVKNMSLQKFFSEIEKKTNYTFFYDVTILKDAKPVTMTVKEATVEEILRMALVGRALEFTINDKTIFVKKEKKVVAVEDLPAGGPGGPPVKVTGVVLTEAGVPVQGANVTIKQTEKGTITNAKGEFVLPAVPPGTVLVFSFVGYAAQSVPVKEAGEVKIFMKVAQNELDKAVVQAYGTTTQRLTTADIGKVTAEEIERQPVMNPLLALQGKVAGLDVSQVNGYASAPVKIELRGRADINPLFTSEPLYIIDGVPLTVNEVSSFSSYSNGSVGFDQTGLSPAGGQSPFFSINPSDIASIEVLKDADATAIYGSRGANGVIIVTTKKGSAGKTKFNLNIQTGTVRVDRFWDMMSTTQYLEMRRQAFLNSGTRPDPIADYDVNGIWDTTRNANWQKILYGGTGKDLNIQSSLSGGDASTTFRISCGYSRSAGITTVNGSDQRASVSLNFSHHSMDQRLSIGSSNTFSFAQSNITGLPGSVLMAPDAPPIYDSSGNLNWAGWGGKNGDAAAETAYPFGSLKNPYVAKTNFLNSNLIISYELLKGLQLTTSFGYNIGQQNQTVVRSLAGQNPLASPNGQLNLGNNRNINLIIEPQFNYSSRIGKGKIVIQGGASSSQNSTEAINVHGFGYLSDLLINNISSAPATTTTDYYADYRYFGVFGRMSFEWDNKYILNLNGRRDGSSRFGPGRQFGNFGSVGAAWIISEERWVKSIIPQAVSFIKIRGSYGTTGSDAVSNYGYLSQYSSNGVYPYNGQTSLVPIIDPNPVFRWQSNAKLEGALNVGLLQDKISIQVAWYRDRCGNQLVAFPTPLLTGFGSVIENSPALIQNSGWEFTTSVEIVKTRVFEVSMNFNAAINKNKLVAYPEFSQSPYLGMFKVGHPLDMQYALHYIGVDPQTGQYSFVDKNHDGFVSYNPAQPGDDSYVLDLSPKVFGGLGMNVSYNGLSCYLFFNIKEQVGKNAFLNLVNEPGALNENGPEEIVGKQWQHPGDNATVAKYSTIYLSSYQLFQESDGAYTDASYIRLSNLAITYTPNFQNVKRIGLDKCTFYFAASNVFVLTKYKGVDPETQNFGGLPPTKAVEGGVKFNF